MSTPNHLKQIDLIQTISLSQQAREIADLSRTMLDENRSFQVSQTAWDAGRVARILRHIAKQANSAADAFSSAAKTGGVNVEPSD